MFLIFYRQIDNVTEPLLRVFLFEQILAKVEDVFCINLEDQLPVPVRVAVLVLQVITVSLYYNYNRKYLPSESESNSRLRITVGLD